MTTVRSQQLVEPKPASATSTRVILLAGGLGTRLAERTDSLPKPLVEIGGRPVLWHILKLYSHCGFDDFLIAAGYRADAIKRFFLEYRHLSTDLLIDYRADTVSSLSPCPDPWRVAVIDTGMDTNTGGRIRRLAPHVGNTFMVTYGDGVGDIDVNALLDFHHTHGRLATFTAVQRPSQFGHPVLDGDRVLSFAEKPDDTDAWISAGFFVFDSALLARIESDDTSLEQHVLPELARDDQLRAYRHTGFWAPMDTLRDVRQLNERWERGDAPWKCWA